MSVRFCSKPVVTAPAGRTLGGGAEVSMAGARTVAAAETYMGLVEAGVGLVPGAGGCKELVRRIVSPAMQITGTDPLPYLQQVLQTIEAVPEVDWADIALQCGYFDQAHFIHDFRAFSGINPSSYVRQRTSRNHVAILD